MAMTPSGVIIANEDGFVEACNEAGEILFGYNRRELVGASIELFLPSFFAETIASADCEHTLHGPAGVMWVTTALHKDGPRFPVQLSAAKREIQGRTHFLCIVQDHAALEPERASLGDEAAYLAQIVQSASDAVIGYSCDGITRSWNRAAEMMLGYAADEVVGEPLAALISLCVPPERAAEEQDIFERAVSGEAVSPYETVRITKDHQIVHVSASVSPIRSAEGKIVGVSGTLRDISERKVLEQQRALLGLVVESSNDAIYTVALDGMIMSFNRAAEELFGYSAEEIIDRSILRLVPTDREAEERTFLEAAAAGRSMRRHESVRLNKDGTLIDVSITVSPIRDSDGRMIGIAKTVRDITERRANEARLQELRDELSHVARITEMTHVSTGIAHELNQPLGAILNYANAVKHLAETGDPMTLDKITESASKIAEQANRTGQIIRRLRNFVEKRKTNRVVEDINLIVEEAVALGLIGARSANITTRLSLAPDAPAVLADRVQIQQVLVNLLRNAVEAMAESPKRELTLTTAPVTGNAVKVVVADTGTGIPEEIAERLFKPFVTSKPDGMGIGLAISHSIIEAYGGRLVALSNPGGGTQFQFTLPAAVA